MLGAIGDDRFGLAHADAGQAFGQGLGVGAVDVDLAGGEGRQGEGEGKNEAGEYGLEVHDVAPCVVTGPGPCVPGEHSLPERR